MYNSLVEFTHEKCYIFGKKEKIHLQNQSWLAKNDLKITKYKRPILFPSNQFSVLFWVYSKVYNKYKKLPEYVYFIFVIGIDKTTVNGEQN